MTTLDARYRRIAAALEQRGTEVKLLNRCTTWDDQLTEEYLKTYIHPDECSGSCHGTGTVVPNQAECFWRLWDEAGGGELEGGAAGGWRFRIFHADPWSEGKDKLEPLLGAVEQSLGLEKEAEA